MDITLGTVASTLRLSLQVLANRHPPRLEIYAQLRHTLGPTEQYAVGTFGTQAPHNQVYRPQEIGLEFSLINIGGERAENIRLTLAGDFEYHSGQAKLSRIPILNGTPIPQLAPAESLHIFRFDAFDLIEYDSEGRPGKSKQEGFTITMTYDGPSQGLNRVRRRVSRIRRPSQFVNTFRFDPRVYGSLDLPTPEVLG